MKKDAKKHLGTTCPKSKYVMYSNWQLFQTWQEIKTVTVVNDPGEISQNHKKKMLNTKNMPKTKNKNIKL